MQPSSYIRMNSGRKFYFDDIQRNVIHVTDIANGLAASARFGGQMDLDKFYSIAEHCINVSYFVPPEFAFCGLMHDAAEAIMGDMVTPLKNLSPDFKKMEREIDSYIAWRFGYQYPFPTAVKQVDFDMFITEYHTVFKNRLINFPGEEDVAEFENCIPKYQGQVKFHFYNPQDAYTAFLKRYLELTEFFGD
jgi:5'-deoxynucleotidase YfbR-like HD superfamily hydrolase